jgi:hypothetical protein
MDGVMTGSDMRCLAVALTMSLVAATAVAADPGHHGAGMGSHGPMHSDDSSTVAPVMTSPAATAASTAPSTAPASNLATRGPSDLYARRVPAGAMRESDAQWQARCVERIDKDSITLVSTYRYKARRNGSHR